MIKFKQRTITFLFILSLVLYIILLSILNKANKDNNETVIENSRIPLLFICIFGIGLTIISLDYDVPVLFDVSYGIVDIMALGTLVIIWNACDVDDSELECGLGLNNATTLGIIASIFTLCILLFKRK